MLSKLRQEKPEKLISHKRFDIGIKLLFLDLKNKSKDLAKNIYKDHIRAFSLGTYKEPGNKKKIGVDKFIRDFESLYKNIKQNGFKKKNFLPITKNGVILNGSHRLSSSIHLSEKVFTKTFNEPDPNYDFNFFLRRKTDIQFMELAAIKIIECIKNPYLAFVWPSANKKDFNEEKLIPNIIYKKNLNFNQSAAKIFLGQIYRNSKWIGNSENKFKGIEKKLLECFKYERPVKLIVFNCDKKKKVKEIKNKIRDLYGIGKSSIHITDTKKDAIYLSKLCLNRNSLHLLNYSKKNKIFDLFTKIASLKKFLKKNNINSNDILFTGSIILSLYGLRKNIDVDYLLPSRNKIKYNFKHINSHKSEEGFYNQEVEQLIYNPKFHFNFCDLKFISFEELMKFKKKRNERKDTNDYKIMKNYVDKNNKYIFFKFYQSIYYNLIKMKFLLISFLKLIGMYKIIKKIYHLTFSK